MKKQFIGRVIVTVIFLPLFLAGLIWYVYSTHLLNVSYRQEVPLDKGWEITVGETAYEDCDLNRFAFETPTGNGEKVTMTRLLPEELPEVASVRALIYLSTVEVMVDGKTLYSYGVDLAEQGKFVGSGYHFIQLPPDAAGKEIVIEIIAASNGAMSNIPPMTILPTEYVYEEFYDTHIVSICCGIFLFTLGVILTFFGLLTQIQKSNLIPLIHIGVFSILIGYWAQCNTKIIQLYSVDLSWNTATEYMSLYYAMLPLLLLVLALRKEAAKWKRVILVVIFVLMLVFALTTTVLHFSGRLFFPETITVFHILAVAAALGMLLASVVFRKDHSTPQDRVLNLALVEILITGVVDILRFNVQKYLMPDREIMSASILPFGVLIFILLLIISYLIGLYGSVIDETEKETLTRLAYQDTLTNLYNRSMSEKLFEECDAGQEDYTLINLDLNGLKKVNDTYGHVQGDQLIKDFAEILTTSFADIGTVIRMGGDEFAVVLKNVDAHTVEDAIDRMEREEEKASWRGEYEISASYGIASRREMPEVTAEHVYKVADERMYEMKVRTKKGRMG
ncbi:MAG: GGDEF domain-containing protein [Lachnospiraceae bacterium]|nr:GGDEF domain-containing protein [Lachnospiraceae bacterium]